MHLQQPHSVHLPGQQSGSHMTMEPVVTTPTPVLAASTSANIPQLKHNLRSTWNEHVIALQYEVMRYHDGLLWPLDPRHGDTRPGKAHDCALRSMGRVFGTCSLSVPLLS